MARTSIALAAIALAAIALAAIALAAMVSVDNGSEIWTSFLFGFARDV